MKRSIAAYRSYCQSVRLWSQHSARLRSTYTCCNDTSRPLAIVHQQYRASTIRTLCTKIEDEAIEEEDEVFEELDEESLQDIGPTVPVHPHRVNLITKFRTDDDDPTQHTMNDVGLYYKVSPTDYEKYVEKAQWPEHKRLTKTFHEATIMVRQPALEVFDLIDNANYDYPPLRLMLYGKVGCGKSMTLSHIVHRCSKMDMLTIHVPNFSRFINFIPKVIKPHAPSDYSEGMIDLIDDAQDWLVYFKAQNEELLKKLDIKTTKDYQWSQREAAISGTNILDVINFGIERKRYASDSIGAVFREIKKAACDKRVKVLVAIEGVNGFWKNTSIRNQENKVPYHAQEVTTLQHFFKLMDTNWHNGICVGTLCPMVEALDNKSYPDKSLVPYTPQALLKKDGFARMDPFIPVLVPEYSHKEAHNCIDYLIDRKWIIKQRALTEAGKKELMMLANYNPREMMIRSGLY